jgi:excinuclease UvrABC helicase subunit UvrB
LKSNKTKNEFKNLGVNEYNKTIKRLELEMDIASANMEYEQAAELRDELIILKKKYGKKTY